MTRRLRIAFYAPGASVHTRRWVESIADRGHQVLLISQGRTDPLRVPVFDPYAGMGALGRLPKFRALVAGRLILRHLAEWQPDLVHLHWLNPTLGTWWLARRIDRLFISVWGRDIVWDGREREPWLHRLCKKGILARGVTITATSRFLAERTGAFVRPKRPIEVVPFGVDCELFHPSADPQERAVPVIGYLKHYTAKYGPDILLRACALLVERGYSFRLLMHGTGDPGPYRKLARELGLETRTQFTGTVEHASVPDKMRGFDIYAMPSVADSETFGVSALEAAACGVPVVASRVGGVPETVLDQETGLLVAPGRPEALAAALQILLSDPVKRRRLGDRGRAFVLQSYRWDDCVQKMQDLYVELVERTQSSRRIPGAAGQ